MTNHNHDTNSKLGYTNLSDTLPVDTITEPAEVVGLSLSVTTQGLVVGSLLVGTKDGWHRFMLGRDDWYDVLAQAAAFSDICNDPAKLAAAVEQLKHGQAEQQ